MDDKIRDYKIRRIKRLVDKFNREDDAEFEEKHKRDERGRFAEKPELGKKSKITKRQKELLTEYDEALQSGNKDWMLQVVCTYADEAGYGIGAYHGSPNSDITEFNTRSTGEKKERLQLLFGTHFTRVKDYADLYARKAKNSKGTNRLSHKQKGKVYSVRLDPGKSLDLESSKPAYEGSELYKLHQDLPEKIKKKIPIREYTESDERASNGELKKGTKYLVSNDIEKALQIMSPKDATQFLTDHGYNSVLYTARYFNGIPGVYSKDSSIIMLDPERIKLEDPITYDDEGKQIPLSDRFNPNSKDIRY